MNANIGTARERRARSWQRSDGTPVRVLIVDDEPTYREYLERFLARLAAVFGKNP